MRLSIHHRTEYRYDEPVQFALQRLRLTPVTGPGQTVVEWTVQVDGATVEVSYADQFLNQVHLVSVAGGRDSIIVTAVGEIETEDRAGVFGPHTAHTPLWLFLRETPLTKPGKLVREIARSSTGESDLARMHALMELINTTVSYTPGATDSLTTAEQALEAKAGVCQDHAHIFIAAARTLSLPARYISGYLLMDEVEQQTATHAWAEVFLTGLGWVGFDAANKICPDARYVRIATGLDYTDAAPISGLVNGAVNETLDVTLTVQEGGQSQSQSQG
ncbi:Transglutaminase-like enzyme, putative cysteine protease [Rhizobium sp. RU20A]|uniref:transglutaminase family protein n=1 Tax=Rhizobium sp. RU20A TaxID=1907412 RepID=UPI0009561596|nr:transglutaminase family protein [Rhizobium sp. RU20A]SIQ29498.1 Transglutaminase-like enzyme, putative cysteine protease [Rhizobium sp. RU20A]